MNTSASPRSGLKSLPRNVWVMTITSFLTDISSEMIFNLLPLFLANVLGVQTSIIGLIEGIAETTSSLLKVASGWFSDRLGSRKGLTIAGYGLSTLAKPFLYVTTGWLGVLAVRFSDRVGKGIRTAPRDALIADSINERQRGLAFGLHRAGDTFGAALGLCIALVVVAAMQTNAVDLERSTFQTLVIISVIPAALAVVTLAFGVREAKSSRSPNPPRLSLSGFSPSFKAFLVIVVIFTLGNSSDAFLILRAQERGLSVAATLGMLIAFNVVYALVAGPAGALSDRFGRKRLILAGWSVYGLIYLGFALAQQAWEIWALYAVYGVYYGVFEGTAKALVADLVPSQQRGTAYGVYNAVIGLAAFPASLLAGILWQGIGDWGGFGASAPFLAGALLSLVAMVMLARWSMTLPKAAA
ncbi:MAG: MFS transporter [Anaerolineae bacterium]|nr:MFS transporter [Anaerolineae bacterium]